MNRFDLLLLGNAIIALIALYQLRACTLLLAGNNTLVSLSLATIQRYGPPSSSTFLPVYVFSEENLATASVILAISLASLVGFTIVSARRRVRIGPDAPAVPKLLLFALAVYVVAFAASTRTVFSTVYGAEARYDLNVGGLHALLCSLILYELARRRLLFAISAWKAYLVIFTVFAVTGYAKGGTGFPTGYLVVSAVLMLPRTGAARRLRNMVRIGVVLGGIVVLALLVRSVRTTLADEGTSVISAFVEQVAESEAHREQRSEGLEATANASQSAAHVLECITLYDAGVSREWRSIYNVIEYTFKPSFLLKMFNWKRSIEAPWELRDHFVHGGGINVLGEFYWNGGLLCVVIMATALSFFCFVLDREWRASPFWLLMLTQFAPAFLMGYGYGFAQTSRGAINGLLVAAAYKGLSSIGLGHPASASKPGAVANLAVDPGLAS